MFNMDINKLRKNNRLDIQIESAIKEELIKIKKNIMNDFNKGNDYSIVKLRYIYHDINYPLKDLKILIYGKIMETLKDKGFNIKFISGKQNLDEIPRFKIDWSENNKSIELNKYRNLLNNS